LLRPLGTFMLFLVLLHLFVFELAACTGQTDRHTGKTRITACWDGCIVVTIMSQKSVVIAEVIKKLHESLNCKRCVFTRCSLSTRSNVQCWRWYYCYRNCRRSELKALLVTRLWWKVDTHFTTVWVCHWLVSEVNINVLQLSEAHSCAHSSNMQPCSNLLVKNSLNS